MVSIEYETPLSDAKIVDLILIHEGDFYYKFLHYNKVST